MRSKHISALQTVQAENICSAHFDHCHFTRQQYTSRSRERFLATASPVQSALESCDALGSCSVMEAQSIFSHLFTDPNPDLVVQLFLSLFQKKLTCGYLALKPADAHGELKKIGTMLRLASLTRQASRRSFSSHFVIRTEKKDLSGQFPSKYTR